MRLLARRPGMGARLIEVGFALTRRHQSCRRSSLRSTVYCGTSRTTGPLGAGAVGTGAFGASVVVA